MEASCEKNLRENSVISKRQQKVIEVLETSFSPPLSPLPPTLPYAHNMLSAARFSGLRAARSPRAVRMPSISTESSLKFPSVPSQSSPATLSLSRDTDRMTRSLTTGGVLAILYRFSRSNDSTRARSLDLSSVWILEQQTLALP